MKELNRELPANTEDINLLLEELSTREEMICKGDTLICDLCGVMV